METQNNGAFGFWLGAFGVGRAELGVHGLEHCVLGLCSWAFQLLSGLGAWGLFMQNPLLAALQPDLSWWNHLPAQRRLWTYEV